MTVRQAAMDEVPEIETMIRQVIETVYPHYNPRGAVEFFLHHHDGEHIGRDVAEGRVYVGRDEDGLLLGTITVVEQDLRRLFVDIQQQGKGYGKALLQFGEELVFRRGSWATLDATIQARNLYEKAGYQQEQFCLKPVGEDFLCYIEMRKQREKNGR